MSPKEQTLGKILQSGLLPNLIDDRVNPERAVEAAAGAGVRAVEVSCRRADTVALVKRLRKEFPDVAVGVCSLIESGPYFRFLQARGPRFPSIDEAVDAGADFLVSVLPFSAGTYERHAALPIIPGLTSAQEAKEQLDLGASLAKFGNIGAAALKSMNGGPVHFGLPLLVAGGIRPEHVTDLVAARTLVCVCGFDLILKGCYESIQHSFDAGVVRSRFADYIAAIAAARRIHRPDVDFASADSRLIQQQSGQFMNVSVPPAPDAMARAARQPATQLA
ncbi:MAG: hypothetical protein ACREH8_22080 [Opitutaceae bacterium]